LTTAQRPLGDTQQLSRFGAIQRREIISITPHGIPFSQKNIVSWPFGAGRISQDGQNMARLRGISGNAHAQLATRRLRALAVDRKRFRVQPLGKLAIARPLRGPPRRDLRCGYGSVSLRSLCRIFPQSRYLVMPQRELLSKCVFVEHRGGTLV
jgi:hypothetical protein